MKRILLALALCLCSSATFAHIFYDSFEYANHEGEPPVGWICEDHSWVCGYLEKDHNRIAHHGDWYIHTNADDSWIFMEQNLSAELKYRYSYWAISDGSYEVEVWVGNGPSVGEMTELLFSRTVNSGEYAKYDEYIESLASNYLYFGIHAVAASGAYYLTLDEFNIDMVARYDLEVDPYEIHTTMNAGDAITIEYDVRNTGYEDLEIFMTPLTQFFTDISFTADGVSATSFPTVPNQSVHCTCTATLMPNIEPGTLCWMDIMFTVSCDCVTTMSTLWVTVNDPTAAVSELPNEAEVLQVEVYDLTGKRMDPTNLKAGIYLERTVTTQGVVTRKFVKQ